MAAALSGNVAHAQLCIGENGSDTVVNEYFDGGVPGVPSTPSVALNAMFDSTHFKDGAKIKLTLKVWDTSGGHYEIDVSAPAKNRIYALGNHTFSFPPFTDQILETVQQDAQTANYFVVTPQEDRKPNIMSTIPAYTVLYVYSHGGRFSFGDCFATSSSSSDYYLNTNDIQTAVGAKNLNQPPYNFAFLDCCNTAGDVSQNPSLSKDLAASILNGNGNSPDGLADRAFLGWKNEVLGCQSNAFWTENVFNNLTQGYNLSDATLLATLQCPEIGQVTPQVPFIFGFVFPEIYGDSRMTLHTVYSGSGADAFPEQWFRPL